MCDFHYFLYFYLDLDDIISLTEHSFRFFIKGYKMGFSNYPLSVISAGLLFLGSNAFAQEWIYYGSNFMISSYYESGSIRDLKNNKTAVQIRQSYTDRDAAIKFFKKYGIYDENVEYEDHKIAQMQIDCTSNAIGVKSATSYRENKEIISEIINEKVNYVPIPEGSLYSILHDLACKSR
jgi:hypothetical protein